MEISKRDWKLFREKIIVWQEKCIESILKEYVDLLNDNTKNASEKFWALEERINREKRHPGVVIELKKSRTAIHIFELIRLNVITIDDIVDFSEELQQEVKRLLTMIRR